MNRRKKTFDFLARIVLSTVIVLNMTLIFNSKALMAAENTGLIIGFLNYDNNPSNTAIGNWGYSASGVAIDFGDTSIGIDQGSIRQVTKVELWDTDNVVRSDPSSNELFWSNDNATYNKINGVSYSERTENGRKIHVFEFTGIIARYIKIHSIYSDTSTYSFIISPFQTSVKAFDENEYEEITTGRHVGFLNNDENPAGTEMTNWDFNEGTGIDYDDTSIGFDVGNNFIVGQIELKDSNDITRCSDISCYELYYSNNNTSYTRIENVTFNQRTESGKRIHSFKFTGIKARYFKVHSTHNDFYSYSFIVDPLQSNVKIFSIPGEYMAGYLNNDGNPTNTAIENWGYSAAGISIDYDDTSVGIDQGRAEQIARVEILDNDNSTRCTASSYELYWSNDNATYTRINAVAFTEWTENGKKVHSFKFSQIKARYIKIHSTYSDFNSSTFVMDPFQTSIKTMEGVGAYTIGVLNNDENPLAASIGQWGYTGNAAIDYDDTSFGIDFGSPKQVTKVELWDDDNSTRCTASSYELYWSNGNTSYKSISGITFSERTENDRKVHSFEFSGITARYIKIHSTYSDQNAYTFVLSPLQSGVKAFDTSCEYVEFTGVGKSIGVMNNDEAPLDNAMANWGYTWNAAIDYDDTSIGIDVGNEKQIAKVELWDNDNSSRCNAADYELYWSNDDASYTKIPFFKFEKKITNGQLINSFEFHDISARYIKIHSTYSDLNAYTFVMQPLQSNVKVYTGIKPDPVLKNLMGATTEKGPFVRLPDGGVLGIGWNDLRAWVSYDEGATWAARGQVPYVIENLTITNDGIIVGVCPDRTNESFEWNDITHKLNTHAYRNCYSVRSLDYGATWSAPVPIFTPGLYYCGSIRDIKELSNGTLLTSVTRLVDEFGQPHHAAVSYYSLDKGQSWLETAGIADVGGWGSHDGSMEPTIEELSDGRVCMIIRTAIDVFYKVYSYNMGVSWDLNTHQATTIDASNSPGYLKRLASGRLIMVYNRVDYADGTPGERWRSDVNFAHVATSMQRTELSIIFSDDNGITWSDPNVISYNGGCYPYVFERNPGEIWILFSGPFVTYRICEKDLV